MPTPARTDRLFDLIQCLRDGRLHRAQDLAARLGVTARTIWRDIDILRATGLAIEGERGLGYVLRMPLTLPQMLLTPAEFEALRQGLRAVAAGDVPGVASFPPQVLARAARSLAAKMAASTPASADPDDIFAARPPRPGKTPPFVPVLRRAIRARHLVSISHVTPSGLAQHADMRPLRLDLKSTLWTLTAYCEAAQDFAVLRLDRIQHVQPTGQPFSREAGREWPDFAARHKADGKAQGSG